MARQKISTFVISSIFLILLMVLAIVYLSEINPNTPIKNQETQKITLKELSENARDYVSKKVIVQGLITSPQGDYMILSQEGADFAVRNPRLTLINGKEYEIQGIVRSRPAMYYRYYTIEYYIEPTNITIKSVIIIE